MTASPLNVLVVEDNADFLNVLCDMITVLGHHPYGLSSAEDALGPLQTHRFDVLVADINLPGMSGIELAQHAIDASPDMRIVFSSGFGYLLSDKLDFDFVLLHKPYFLEQLKQVIGQHDIARSA